MKTRNLKSLVLVLLVTLSLSCSKDDDTTTNPIPEIPEKNPLAGYLESSGFNQMLTNQLDAGDYEFGISFIPLVNGKMTAIVCKIPDTHPAMRVTIWDKVTGDVLRTEYVDMTAAGLEVTKIIEPLTLVKDKEYFLTFNSNDWYDHRRTDNANVTYPFTVEDIKITSYAYKSGASQSIPNSPQLGYYAGDCSFKFKKS